MYAYTAYAYTTYATGEDGARHRLQSGEPTGEEELRHWYELYILVYYILMYYILVRGNK